MQALCHWDVQGDQSDEQVRELFSAREAPIEAARYAEGVLRIFWAHRKHFDALIESGSPRWSLDRISPVERNIMRVAVAEMFEGKVPPKVAIDEAIEIAREYGGVESPRFVNGVLDVVHNKLREDSG